MTDGAAGSSAILSAVMWLQALLLGPLATTIAVIAVGWTGMMMLSGRFGWRRGVSVILGCFIVFGASGIAVGIMGLVGDGSIGGLSPIAPTVEPARLPDPSPRGDPYDPYAGAGTPTTGQLNQ